MWDTGYSPQLAPRHAPEDAEIAFKFPCALASIIWGLMICS